MEDTSDALALAPEGQKLPAFDQTPEQMALGRRAALELQLIDALADRARAVVEKNSHTHQADVYRAWADEATTAAARVSRNASAVKYRLRAAAADAEIAAHDSRIAMLQGMLRPAKAEVVMLTAEQCSAVDDTHNFRAEAA